MTDHNFLPIKFYVPRLFNDHFYFQGFPFSVINCRLPGLGAVHAAWRRQCRTPTDWPSAMSPGRYNRRWSAGRAAQSPTLAQRPGTPGCQTNGTLLEEEHNMVSLNCGVRRTKDECFL